MPRLVILTGERRGELIGLKSPLTIGSDRSSTLHLRDPRVSWSHARVWCDRSGEVRIEDLGSADGTLLNGARSRAAVFRPGDVLQVGGVQLALLPGGEDEASPSAEEALIQLRGAREIAEKLLAEKTALGSRVEDLSAELSSLREAHRALGKEHAEESAQRAEEIEKL